mmetsp:Transcript_7640/g.21744  ORF Transcript_7640/g.21744 Transcript_7640/m.21744 type:complete len:290 (-) Transcript_7640:3688-4557(-)
MGAGLLSWRPRLALSSFLCSRFSFLWHCLRLWERIHARLPCGAEGKAALLVAHHGCSPDLQVEYIAAVHRLHGGGHHGEPFQLWLLQLRLRLRLCGGLRHGCWRGLLGPLALTLGFLCALLLAALQLRHGCLVLGQRLLVRLLLGSDTGLAISRHAGKCRRPVSLRSFPCHRQDLDGCLKSLSPASRDQHSSVASCNNVASAGESSAEKPGVSLPVKGNAVGRDDTDPAVLALHGGGVGRLDQPGAIHHGADAGAVIVVGDALPAGIGHNHHQVAAGDNLSARVWVDDA